MTIYEALVKSPKDPIRKRCWPKDIAILEINKLQFGEFRITRNSVTNKLERTYISIHNITLEEAKSTDWEVIE